MANRNDQKAMFDYLQSLYFQNAVNRGPNSASAGRIPMEGGPGVGWMGMMGGVPNVSYGGRMAPTRSDVLLAGAKSRGGNSYARNAYNQMKRQEAKQARIAAGGYRGVNSWAPQYNGPNVGYAPNQFSQEPSLHERLAQSYLDAQTAANQANELRYNQGLGLAIGSRDRNMERIEQLGAQQASDIREDYDKAGKASYADLVGRGLGGTTVTSAVAGNNLKEQTKSLNRLQDNITRQRIDTDANLTRNIQDFIERRNDTAPDLNQLIGLSEGLGRGNNGQGFGYIPQTRGVYTGGGMLAYNDPQYGGGAPLRGTPSTGGGYGNDMRTNPQFQPYQAPQQPMNFGAPQGGGWGYSNPATWQEGFASPGRVGPPNYRTAFGGGSRLNAQQLGARPTVDYAAAAQYEKGLNAPAPQPQQQNRYQPGGGGYRSNIFRSLPAPQFAPAGNFYGIPNASYGNPMGVSGWYRAGGGANGGGGSVPGVNAPATMDQKRNVARNVMGAFNPIGTETVSRGANQLGQLFGQASNYLGGWF